VTPPGLDQPPGGRAVLAGGRLALGTDRAGMGDELLGDLALGGVPVGTHHLGAALGIKVS
jgi:hypothetical protein